MERYPIELIKEGFVSTANFYNTIEVMFKEKNTTWLAALFTWGDTYKGHNYWRDVYSLSWEEFVGTEAYDILLRCLQNRYKEVKVDIKELL